MAECYVYAANATDCSTIGLCGALSPSSLLCEMIVNGMIELTMEHPVDELGKYHYLVPGAILKVEIPVRILPVISEGTIVSHYEYFKVKDDASTEERKVWTKEQQGKASKKLAAGTTVVVTKVGEHGRTQVQSGKVKGWMTDEALEATHETIDVPATVAGIERAVDPWRCREQLFRIYKTQQSGDGVSVSARHISYDLMYNITTLNETGQLPLRTIAERILSDCIDAHDFTITTNLNGSQVGALYRDTDPITALLDPDRGVVPRWDAVLMRDNYELCIVNATDADRGFRISYGGNARGIDCETSYDSVATRIRPVGEDDKGNPLYLSGNDGCVDSPNRSLYPFDRINILQCPDAKIQKNSMTRAEALARMRSNAEAAFENGADKPKITLRAQFAYISKDKRYSDYADLDKVFPGDTVTVTDERFGIDIKTNVVRCIWDCQHEEMTTVELGSLAEQTPSISGWQIASGVSGAKLTNGSVTGTALGSNAVAERHITAESVNAEAMQTESFTAEKAFIVKLNALNIDAVSAKISDLTADVIETGTLDADEITARLASFADLRAAFCTMTEAQIKDLWVETGIVDREDVDTLFAKYLTVDYLQAANATVGRMVLLGDDGEYHQIHIDGSGNVTSAIVEVSEAERAAGYTEADREDGQGNKQIIEDPSMYRAIRTEDLSAEHGIFRKLVATDIDVQTLIARNAFILALRTASITSDGDSIEIIAGKAKAAQEAADEAVETVESVEVEAEEQSFHGESVSAALAALDLRTTGTANITFGPTYPSDAREGDYHFLDGDNTVHRRAFPENLFDAATGYATCSGGVTYQATGAWGAGYIPAKDITANVKAFQPYTATAAAEQMIVTGGKSVTVKDAAVAKAKNILSRGVAALEMDHSYIVAWKNSTNADPTKAKQYAPTSVVIGAQPIEIGADGSFTLAVSAPKKVYFSEPVNLHVAAKAALWPVESGAVAEAVIRAANAANTADRKIACYSSETYPDSGVYEAWEPEELEFTATRDRFLRFDGATGVVVWKKETTASTYTQHIEESDAQGVYAEIIAGYDYSIEGGWTGIRSALYDAGDLWFDTQAVALRRWNGVSWTDAMDPVITAATEKYDEYITKRSGFFDVLAELPQHMSIRDGVSIWSTDEKGNVVATMELKGSEIRFDLNDRSFTRMGAGFLQMGEYQVKSYADKGGLAFMYAPVKEDD